jgi:hypothetical protein
MVYIGAKKYMRDPDPKKAGKFRRTKALAQGDFFFRAVVPEDRTFLDQCPCASPASVLCRMKTPGQCDVFPLMITGSKKIPLNGTLNKE